jgi:DNA (cytosine-5)-methyltransferase 1
MLLPSPTTSDANGAGAHGTGGPDLRTALAGMSRLCDAWTERMKAAHNNGNGHGASLNIEAQRVMDLLPTPKASNFDGSTSDGFAPNLRERVLDLLPTTTTTDAKASGASYPSTDTHQQGTTLTDATVRQPERWGKYAAAIARWERVTRPAPEPTNITDGYLKALAKRLARLNAKPVGMRGSLKPRRQLAARFSEWMMGVPLGWITDTPGITRNEALKAAGNGVVPQQAAEALRFLLDMPTGREIADAHEPDDLFELLAVSAT